MGSQIDIAAVRVRLRAVVDHKRFQTMIVALIIVNALVLGLQTMASGETAHALDVLDKTLLWIFVAELTARIVAYGPDFLRDPWSIFDTAIIAIALVPATGALSVLRALRILRVLRLINAVPSMRRVVSGLMAALPGMGSVSALLVLVLYVAMVISTNLYGATAPQYFGDLGTSAFTLFQTMTGEAWPDIARDVMQHNPTAWVFFVIFILVMSFAMLNLFLAVLVSGLESVEEKERQESGRASGQENDAVLAALAGLREELTAARAEIAEVRGELRPREAAAEDALV